MDDLNKLKVRKEKLAHLKKRAHLHQVPVNIEGNRHLSGVADEDVLSFSDVSQDYSQRILNFDSSVSRDEINLLLRSLDDLVDPMDHILEPVFLSLFDGAIRAFNIGAAQGITASRLYSECKSFTYNNSGDENFILDSYTEYVNERDSIAKFDSKSSYKDGKLNRDGSELNIRDDAKMSLAKKQHFQNKQTAPDEYGGKEIYNCKDHAKADGESWQAAERDHVVPCREVCERLKKNKALTNDDIKSILNSEENLAITSAENNRGANIGKFDKTQVELQQEINQGYVVNAQGEKHSLSEDELQRRKNMVENMKSAQTSIDKKANTAVVDNLMGDKEIQKDIALDASKAATHQAFGDLVVLIIKPLHYELKDCFVNGIEEGVGVDSFKSALSFRVNRLRSYVTSQASTQLEASSFLFFKRMIGTLLEGVVNCFVGVFKNVFRMVKEGFHVLMKAFSILQDADSSMAEKGDAILKLAASSLTIFASIGIESMLNNLGIVEPWSVIISSMLTAVLTALCMYLFDKIDLFGAKCEYRLNKIDEILKLKAENAEFDILNRLSNLV